MSTLGNARTSVSTLMGTSIVDAGGRAFGRVREFAVAPLVDASRVRALVVRLATAERGSAPSLVSVGSLWRDGKGQLSLVAGADVAEMGTGDDYLMLERDLLDQQIIDVNGHKVVRVNDVDMVWETVPRAGGNGTGIELSLRIAEVEVGLRGAARRLLKGLPERAVEGISDKLKPTVIPWDFVDLIDRDPARRVRLKIEQDRLTKMHPSDLADILEELAPAERQALFSSLDEEVAADTLEEVEGKTQRTLIEGMDSERVAGILDEMDPGAAADLLGELSEERSDAILEEMGEKERHEVEELLEHSPDSAAGLMTTEFFSVGQGATVADAMVAMRAYEGDVETLTDIFVVDGERRVVAVVPLSKVMLAEGATIVAELSDGHVACVGEEANGRKVAELFDKYNLRCLSVHDGERRLVGVVQAEHVIAWLRTS